MQLRAMQNALSPSISFAYEARVRRSIAWRWFFQGQIALQRNSLNLDNPCLNWSKYTVPLKFYAKRSWKWTTYIAKYEIHVKKIRRESEFLLKKPIRRNVWNCWTFDFREILKILASSRETLFPSNARLLIVKSEDHYFMIYVCKSTCVCFWCITRRRGTNADGNSHLNVQAALFRMRPRV